MTQPGDVRIRRALLSVSDKRGIVDFARGLADLGIELVSTGGTAAELSSAGLAVRPIEDFTGFPEMMDGRVKTLHPRLYAGLLARRDEPSHMVAAEEHGIEFTDLVCVNLYPFERTAGRRGASDHEIIENIDIGGPTMIRAAAKNARSPRSSSSPRATTPCCRSCATPTATVAGDAREPGGRGVRLHRALRHRDRALVRRAPGRLPDLLMNAYEKVVDLSYGENPHQRAAYYSQVGSRMHVLSMIKQIHGKELSFNNVLDLNAAACSCRSSRCPACAIIKHNNPCGCAVGASAIEAYQRAFAGDPLSAFGGVICVNRAVDAPFAEALSQQFAEAVFAPRFTDEALEILQAKKNLRILEDNERRRLNHMERDIKRVMGGLLVQDRDMDFEDRTEMEVVTERKPNEREWGEMLFAWKVCKHVRSNAIVIVRDLASVGIGAGQMSRVDSVRLAIEKAAATDTSLEGTTLASDAFFPFSDGPQLALDAGVAAIIQPGGSVRDPEVVEAADAAGISMVFTHRRHFKH
jgi:phosphoribosylaminoimidazolecarboxamide formyltransferase/IMP cyclohydrolase